MMFKVRWNIPVLYCVVRPPVPLMPQVAQINNDPYSAENSVNALQIEI